MSNWRHVPSKGKKVNPFGGKSTMYLVKNSQIISSLYGKEGGEEGIIKFEASIEFCFNLGMFFFQFSEKLLN